MGNYSTLNSEDAAAGKAQASLALSNVELTSTPGALRSLFDAAELDGAANTHGAPSAQRLREWAGDFLFAKSLLEYEDGIPIVQVGSSFEGAIAVSPKELERLLEMVSILKREGFPRISFQRAILGENEDFYAGILLEDPEEAEIYYLSQIKGMMLRTDRIEEGNFSAMWESFINLTEDNFPRSPLR